MVNGEVFEPKDGQGNDVPVFIYEGTTYAPVRALAETYGLTVGWDEEQNLVTVDVVLSGLLTEDEVGETDSMFSDEADEEDSESEYVFTTEKVGDVEYSKLVYGDKTYYSADGIIELYLQTYNGTIEYVMNDDSFSFYNNENE